MAVDWGQRLEAYEKFLCGIDLDKYAPLRSIKTVEQDLPKELLPLDVFYRYYWDRQDFRNFDEVFKIYWFEKLSPHIYKFIKKYFYGCSIEFVEEGFKARLYRTWVSILTQFHFQYLWNAISEKELISSAELDAAGIDAIVVWNSKKIGIQIKKVSYRREASSRRFTRRQRNIADVIVEVPYIVDDPEELEEKIHRARRDDTREKYRKQKMFFDRYLRRLPNGFVIFRPRYIYDVEETIREYVFGQGQEVVPYSVFYNM